MIHIDQKIDMILQIAESSRVKHSSRVSKLWAIY